MPDALFRKLDGVVSVTDDMRTAIRAVCRRRETFERGDHIARTGERYRAIYLVIQGWASRYRLTESGGRQIVNFALPGDFLCFNASLFPASEHSIQAHTDLQAYTIPIRPFLLLLSHQPMLALALAWFNAQEEALLAERIVSLGRRNARQRIAHLFCELWRRQEIVGLTDDSRLELPLTQQDLGDLLGLTPVHVSRTLRRLHTESLISVNRRSVRIDDMTGLERLAGFDGGYLHFSGGRPMPGLAA